MSKRLIKSTAAFSSMTFISRILGLVRDVVVAQLFGANGLTDAFFVAFKIPNFLRRLFAEGAFSQAFVPVLSEYKVQQSPDAVQRFVNRMSGTLAVILAVITGLGILAAPGLIGLFAPAFYVSDPHRFDLAVDMLRITFPYIFFISLTAFAGGVLNTYKRFAAPAFTPVLLNVALIASAFLLRPYFSASITALAWGVFIGGVIQLLFQYPFLWRIRLIPHWRWGWRDPGVQRVLKLMIPALFGVSVAQIGLLFDTIFASFLPAGSISWLYNSERLMLFPLGVFGVALATVVLPHLSQQYAKKSTDEYTRTLDWGLRSILLLGIPAALGLMLLSGSLIATLFYHGHRFNLFDVLMTQRSLIAYSLGIPFMMSVKVLASAFYARQDIKTPVRIAVVALIINMALNLALIFPLQHAGLALASALTSVVNAGLLLCFLIKRNIFMPQAGWGKFIGQISVATILMIITLWWLNAPLEDWINWAWWYRIVILVAIITTAVIVYFASLWCMGMRPGKLLKA